MSEHEPRHERTSREAEEDKPGRPPEYQRPEREPQLPDDLAPDGIQDRAVDQLPDDDEPLPTEPGRPNTGKAVDPPAQQLQPPPGAAPAASPSPTVALPPGQAARLPRGPALDILPLGTGLALIGFGLAFMGLRLRRR